jgi:hypothetical protein
MKTHLIAAALIAQAVCAQAARPQSAPAQGPDRAWVAEAQAVAQAVPPRLLSVLQTEIARSGYDGAIAACRDQAPAMARTASEKTGWNIRRVSLRNRNPKAVPDAWERAALEDFDRRAAAGEPPVQLERAEITQEDGQATQRYMRALPTAEMCLGCHGTPDHVSSAVTARLQELYPADRALGYRVGEIRGAITLHRPAR